MLRHHFNARRERLERLIAKGENRVTDLAAVKDETPTGKRVRTMAARALERNRKALRNLIELHGEAFGVHVERKDK